MGPRPSEFGLCDPDDDFPLMLAHYRSVNKMKAVEMQQMEDDQAKQAHQAPARKRGK